MGANWLEYLPPKGNAIDRCRPSDRDQLNVPSNQDKQPKERLNGKLNVAG